MKSTTAEKTIKVMRTLFESYGIPEQVVSDNGPQFTLDEFAEFMRRNGIKHIRTTHIILQPTGWLNVSFKHSKEPYKQVNRVADLLTRSWSIFYSVIAPHHTTPHHTAQQTGLLAVYS